MRINAASFIVERNITPVLQGAVTQTVLAPLACQCAALKNIGAVAIAVKGWQWRELFVGNNFFVQSVHGFSPWLV
jgi:hypothetical protein